MFKNYESNSEMYFPRHPIWARVKKAQHVNLSQKVGQGRRWEWCLDACTISLSNEIGDFQT